MEPSPNRKPPRGKQNYRSGPFIVDENDPRRFCHICQKCAVRGHDKSITYLMKEHMKTHDPEQKPKPKIPCQSCDLMVVNSCRKAHNLRRHEPPKTRILFEDEYKICNLCKQAWWPLQDVINGRFKDNEGYDDFKSHQNEFCPKRKGCDSWKQSEDGSWVRKIPIDGPGKGHRRGKGKHAARDSIESAPHAAPDQLNFNRNDNLATFVPLPRLSPRPPSPQPRSQQPHPYQHTPLHHPALLHPYHFPHYETDFANSVPLANQAHVSGLASDSSLLHQNYHYTGLPDPSSLCNQVPPLGTSEFFPHLSGSTHPAPAPLPSDQSLVPQSHFYHDIPGQYLLPSSFETISQNHHDPNFDRLSVLQQAAPSLPVDYNPWMYPDMTGILGQEQSEEWQRTHQQHSLEKRIRAPRLTRRQALRYGDALE